MQGNAGLLKDTGKLHVKQEGRFAEWCECALCVHSCSNRKSRPGCRERLTCKVAYWYVRMRPWNQKTKAAGQAGLFKGVQLR